MAMPAIALIGAGFSGLMTAWHLVEKSQTPFTLHWCDPSPHWYRGAAYSTTRSEHLLNVPVEKMGAFADKSDDFFHWLQSPAGQAAKSRHGIIHDYAPYAFVPRVLYGDYLCDIATRLDDMAQQKGVVIHRHRQAIDAAMPVADGYHLPAIGETVQALILATGNQFIAQGAAISEPWQTDFAALAKEAPTEVALIGSGLTAVDTIISLLNAGYRGKINVYSRHGWLPLPHPAAALPAYPKALTMGESFAANIQQLRMAAAQHESWQPVVDALRPQTIGWWQSQNVDVKNRFLSRYFTLWNIHRHRMAASIHAQLVAALRSGQLQLHRISKVQSTAAVQFQCTGPSYRRLSPLLQSLVQQQCVVPHPTGAGLGEVADGQVNALNAPPIFALGALLLGSRLEATAVPELRMQAEQVAGRCLESIEENQNAR